MAGVKSRREEYSEATRAALLAGARRLFAERGYAATSLDEIAAAARVTKGALYHHFANKQALLEELARELDQDVIAWVTAAFSAAQTPWQGVLAALRAFLDACSDPAYSRLVFRELPAVMGRQEWWDEGEATFGVVVEQMLLALVDARVFHTASVPLTARLFYAALCETALVVAAASDPVAERQEAEAVLTQLLSGLLVDPALAQTAEGPARDAR